MFVVLDEVCSDNQNCSRERGYNLPAISQKLLVCGECLSAIAQYVGCMTSKLCLEMFMETLSVTDEKSS